MDRRQISITVGAVVLALVLGAGVALLASSGSDEGAVRTGGELPISTSSTSSTAPSSTTTTTRPPIVTVPTRPPGTIVVVPEQTTTTKAKRPRRTTTTAAPATTTTAAPTTTTTSTPPTTVPESTSTAPSTTASTTTSSTVTSTTAPAAGEIGVSARHIRFAVIADDVDALAGARAWADVVNRRGGIAGRKVRLDLLPTGGTADGYTTAVTTACGRDLAIVASLSTFDADTTPLGCGIPDIAIETLSDQAATHDTTYAAFPRRAGTAAVGPYRYLQSAVTDCCSQFVLVPDRGPERATTEAAIAAAREIGFDTVATPDVSFDATEADYDALAQDLLAANATFVSSGLGRDSTIELRGAADRAGVTGVGAWYCDARCYDPSFLTEGATAVEGEYVAIETVPFGDRRRVPAMRTYLAATARDGETPDYDGLRAYVTGMLTQQALGAVVDAHGKGGITRTALLDALAAVRGFTAEGLIGPTEVGDRTPNGCTVVLQVRDGKFARVDPEERGSLDCDAENLVELER
jgi:ABC-type branched-subunit amino acid transport system substrate-binding protein